MGGRAELVTSFTHSAVMRGTEEILMVFSKCPRLPDCRISSESRRVVGSFPQYDCDINMIASRHASQLYCIPAMSSTSIMPPPLAIFPVVHFRTEPYPRELLYYSTGNESIPCPRQHVFYLLTKLQLPCEPCGVREIHHRLEIACIM